MKWYFDIKEWLDENEVSYDEDILESTGEHFIRFTQRIGKSNSIVTLLIFKELGIKTVFVDLANIEDEEKHFACYELMNNLNADYSYLKFFMTDDGEVRAEYDVVLSMTDGNFDADEFMKLFISVFSVIEENYPKFMKLQWI